MQFLCAVGCQCATCTNARLTLANPELQEYVLQEHMHTDEEIRFVLEGSGAPRLGLGFRVFNHCHAENDGDHLCLLHECRFVASLLILEFFSHHSCTCGCVQATLTCGTLTRRGCASPAARAT